MADKREERMIAEKMYAAFDEVSQRKTSTRRLIANCLIGLPTFSPPDFPSKQEMKLAIWGAFEGKGWLLKASSGYPTTERSDFSWKPKGSGELLDVFSTLKPFVSISCMSCCLLRGEIGGRKCWEPS
jgi:hypothetical protein